MSERLITLSNVPGREFTVNELISIQSKGVVFTFWGEEQGSLEFDSPDQLRYAVKSSSLELFKKLTNPAPEVSTEVATAVAGEFVIPDKFNFKHQSNRHMVYQATKQSGGSFLITWDAGDYTDGGHSLYDSDVVESNIKAGYWIEVESVESSKPQATFEDVKLKLKEAQKALVEAQQSVAQYEKLYKEFVAAEEFGFSLFKKA